MLLFFRRNDSGQNLIERILSPCHTNNLTVTQIIAVKLPQIYKLLKLQRPSPTSGTYSMATSAQ